MVYNLNKCRGDSKKIERIELSAIPPVIFKQGYNMNVNIICCMCKKKIGSQDTGNSVLIGDSHGLCFMCYFKTIHQLSVRSQIKLIALLFLHHIRRLFIGR